MSDVTVRSIDPDLWRQLKAGAAMTGLTVGELLNMILAKWVADQKVLGERKVA